MSESDPLIAAVDVDYRDASAVAGCVVFRGWAAETWVSEGTVGMDAVMPYESGEFYRRELGCLLDVLKWIDQEPEVVIVDGYVWLDPAGRPGLGARLYEALGKKLAVVGVAKSRFATATNAVAVRRGKSKSPLYVTAVGMSLADAVAGVSAMHGAYRIPTLLKRVDRICRAAPGR
jgi:deoxyribonuclease V